ncbi:MAG: hypothetical protein AUJ96_25885 [Armatimonadetes bacterium CG2_30_66_41]|nr:FAD-binding protein [Armatimonadota bacterium]OIO95798.1 MAG: hypothetical protein AUJ96_25885 [Armatimonadetes bacterium CG2_30_66_41]PIX44352.1 MAG: FAD-binding oxidoreductase [Armatimonadetes bacterium CG_4_8_14_3_um_filter_66_20]
MVDAQLLARLRQLVGRQHVAAGETDAEVYSYDGSLASARPEAVVFPADTAQTAAVVRALAAAGVPFVPRGFGTNLSGGSVTAAGGVVLSLARLNRILALDKGNRLAIAQPGVTNLELQNALAPLGYYYAPDPASQKVATLGGNLGENSGGPHCLKYGVTTNHVLGMTAVMPDGEVQAFGGPALDPPGLDLRGLMVGSEGTLGIVTEVTVRLLPKPESVVTLLVVYDDLASAAQTVSDIIAAGIVPATLEMMDAPVLEAVEKSVKCGYPLDAAAVLIIEVDGPAAGLDGQAQRIMALCERNGCRDVRRAKDAAERDLLWAGRRGAFGAVARLAPNYLVNDCTVPRSKLPEALARVGEIARKHDLLVGNVFHAGDGNLHPLLLFDSRDEDQVGRVEQAGWEIMEACVALGGTISGEHGIGTEKRKAMRMVCSEDDLEFQRAVKRALDPKNLLNPGKIVPAPATGEAGSARVSDRAAATTGSLQTAEFTPATVAEACDFIRQACQDRAALFIQGNGRRAASSLGNAIRLRTTRLSALVEHDHVNQVVTAQAGMPLADLQAALAAHNQWLPLRPPLNDRCTLGGVAALNVCGPDRLRYGAPRDLLLGLKFVSGTGKLIVAGGRVVKNVTGYDLTRLLCGSAGTLGLLTELTFRTLPLPEQSVALQARGPWEACAAAAAALLDSTLDPTYLAATPTGTEDDWRLHVGYEGFAEMVEAQLSRTRSRLAERGWSRLDRRTYAPGENAFATVFARLQSAPALLRVDAPLGALCGFVPQAQALWPAPDMLADFGCGRLLAAAASLPEEAWCALHRIAADANGHAVLERAPANLSDGYRMGELFQPEWRLARALKAQLDPDNIFAA